MRNWAPRWGEPERRIRTEGTQSAAPYRREGEGAYEVSCGGVYGSPASVRIDGPGVFPRESVTEGVRPGRWGWGLAGPK